MKKKVALVLGALSAVYMFVPEPTDLIPILGWLDEGAAAAILMWSLKTLGMTPGEIIARLSGNRREQREERAALASAG